MSLHYLPCHVRIFQTFSFNGYSHSPTPLFFYILLMEPDFWWGQMVTPACDGTGKYIQSHHLAKFMLCSSFILFLELIFRTPFLRLLGNEKNPSLWGRVGCKLMSSRMLHSNTDHSATASPAPCSFWFMPNKKFTSVYNASVCMHIMSPSWLGEKTMTVIIKYEHTLQGHLKHQKAVSPDQRTQPQ